MLKSAVRTLLHRLRHHAGFNPYLSDRDAGFLTQVTGVIHVGANTGQERYKYYHFDIDALWVEPLPDVFRILQSNIRPFAKQKAVQALLGVEEGREYDFHVASNTGASSSMFAPAAHLQMFPNVAFSKVLKIRGTTLDGLVARERIDVSKYQAMVLDTQGSELLVLMGAEKTLEGIRFVKTEACDFESYAGGCTLDQIDAFLSKQGFRQVTRREVRSRPDLGTYFDVLYEK